MSREFEIDATASPIEAPTSDVFNSAQRCMCSEETTSAKTLGRPQEMLRRNVAATLCSYVAGVISSQLLPCDSQYNFSILKVRMAFSSRVGLGLTLTANSSIPFAVLKVITKSVVIVQGRDVSALRIIGWRICSASEQASVPGTGKKQLSAV